MANLPWRDVEDGHSVGAIRERRERRVGSRLEVAVGREEGRVVRCEGADAQVRREGDRRGAEVHK